MRRPDRANELHNPLDALPVLYGMYVDDLAAASEERTGVDRVLHRPIRRTRTVVLIISAVIGVFTAIGTYNAFGATAGRVSLVPPLMIGFIVAAITAVSLALAGRSARAMVSRSSPPPPPVVLARTRRQFARALRDRAQTDPLGAAMQLAATRADWLALVERPAPAVGRLHAGGYRVMRPEFPPLASLMLWLLCMAGAVALWWHGHVFIALALVFIQTPLRLIGWMNPVRTIRRHSTRALRDSLCSCCGYDLRGLPSPVPRLSELGPARCPECAARWPLSPPPIEERRLGGARPG